MKKVVTILMLAILLVPACKSGNNKNASQRNADKTLVELVQNVTESQKMGIWEVEGLHSSYIPTIRSERIRDNTNRELSFFYVYFPGETQFFLKMTGEFPTAKDDEMANEFHLKSNNQEELVIYGSTNYRHDDTSFNMKDAKTIFKYLFNATSSVTFTAVGADKALVYEVPVEGFKEVCKCWFNALQERGMESLLK